MNPTIKLLLELQEFDKKLDGLKEKWDKIPGHITDLEQKIAHRKDELQNSKSELTKIQVAKKGKEVEVDSLDGLIAKHQKDLNNIKSNEAYRALLTEIENAKNQKIALEDQLLEMMESIERLSQEQKENAKTFQEEEVKIQEEIRQQQSEAERLKSEMAQHQSERRQYAASLPEEGLKQYEYLRSHGKGFVLVPLQGASCGGCRMTLPPQTVNEIKKMKAEIFVQCERCQRILYLLEPSESPAKP